MQKHITGTVRDLEFLCKNEKKKIHIHLLATFPKNCFPAISKFLTQWVLEKLHVVPLRKVEFPEFWPLEFRQKLKMSFISKTLKDRVISSNVWTLWVLETLDIVSEKNLNFQNFVRHLEFWRKLKMLFISKTVRDRQFQANFCPFGYQRSLVYCL